MKYLCIDFETKDRYIKKLGPGFPYEQYHKGMVDVLGCAVYYLDGEEVVNHYITPRDGEWDELFSLLDKTEYVIAHNCSYELGLLHMLGYPIKKLKLYDTKILGVLENNLQNTSLDALMSKHLDIKKDLSGIAKSVVLNLPELVPPGLMKQVINPDELNREIKYQQKTKPLSHFLYGIGIVNMDLLQERDFDTVAYYANVDTEGTYKLFEYYKSTLTKQELDLGEMHATLNKHLVLTRAKGVNVSIETLIKFTIATAKDRRRLRHDVWSKNGGWFNVNSNKQVGEFITKLNLHTKLPVTKTGQLKTGKAEIAALNDERLDSFKNYQIIDKLHQYLMKFIEIQKFIYGDRWKERTVGKLHPELNSLGTKTGRFSSRHPNIQQMPKDNSKYKHLGYSVRDLFLPDEGQRWYSLDYNNQEGRLQIDLGAKCKIKSAMEMADKYHKNPYLNEHTEVASIMGVDRKTCKAINLGISYGMGNASLALNLNTTEGKAKMLRNKYNMYNPYKEKLSKALMTKIKMVGYVKTIAGRKIFKEAPFWKDGRQFDPAFRAFNHRTQGSAFDQMAKALFDAYESGVNVLFSVHDEANISGTLQDAQTMEKCMINAYKLAIPVVVEYNKRGGLTWTEACEEEEKCNV